MCCSSYTAVIVAGVLGLVESLRGLGWNLEIAILIAEQEANFTYTPPAISLAYVTKEHIFFFGVAIACSLLYIIWFMCACLLLAGNSMKKRGLLWPWLCHTQIMTLLSVFLGVMCFVQYSQMKGQKLDLRMRRSAYFRLGIGYSGWFFAVPVLNSIFTIYAVRRMFEITKELTREIVASSFVNHADLGYRTSDPPPYGVAVGDHSLNENQTINPGFIQFVRSHIGIGARRVPPERPPPPDLSRVSGWSHQNLLRNDSLSNDRRETTGNESTETPTVDTTVPNEENLS